MGDLLTTDWIEQEKQAQDVEARQSEERSLYSALTEALAKSEGPSTFRDGTEGNTVSGKRLREDRGDCRAD